MSDFDDMTEARVRAAKHMALEARAVALIRQYGFLLPGPAKELFRELADFLNWPNLKATLK